MLSEEQITKIFSIVNDYKPIYRSILNQLSNDFNFTLVLDKRTAVKNYFGRTYSINNQLVVKIYIQTIYCHWSEYFIAKDILSYREMLLFIMYFLALKAKSGMMFDFKLSYINVIKNDEVFLALMEIFPKIKSKSKEFLRS